MNDPRSKEAVSTSPPRYSLMKVASTIKNKGPFGAMEDIEQGPHVHLTLLLLAVIVVSFLIIAITSFI